MTASTAPTGPTAPYERMLDSGEPIDYARLSSESQDAWLSVAAAVAEGL